MEEEEEGEDLEEEEENNFSIATNIKVADVAGTTAVLL